MTGQERADVREEARREFLAVVEDVTHKRGLSGIEELAARVEEAGAKLPAQEFLKTLENPPHDDPRYFPGYARVMDGIRLVLDPNSYDTQRLVEANWKFLSGESLRSWWPEWDIFLDFSRAKSAAGGDVVIHLTDRAGG